MLDFSKISLKNKIFFLNLMVILIVSVVIAFLARWILVSSLSEELKTRGIAIARSISQRGSGYILDQNRPKLLSLIYDEATLPERRQLVNYIFVADDNSNVICHTMTRSISSNIANLNPVPAGEKSSVALATIDNQKIYDVAVPTMEGIHRIATVHVGLSKAHMESLVSKLRSTFLGFIFVVIIILFVISHYLAKQITQPISRLTRLSDKLSTGNIDLALLEPQNITEEETDHHPENHLPTIQDMYQSLFKRHPSGLNNKDKKGDEVLQLANSFTNMLRNIRLYRKRLMESENKYRSLFDSGPDPIFVVDCCNHRILDANPRVEEVYKYTKEEIIGKDFSDLGPEHNQEVVQELENECNVKQLLHYSKRLHYKQDGSPFFVNIRLSPLSYKGRQAAIIATTDITDMIEKDAQLIQASKMKTLGEMSAGMAHELNQPLNAIKMGSDFLLMSMQDTSHQSSDKTRQVLEDITAQVDRATQIINNLREFGRKSTIFKNKININDSIKNVYSILRTQFKLDNIDFQLNLKEDLPLIQAHDNRLQQVIFNLINNARDAILEKGKDASKPINGLIRIRTSCNSQKVVLEVEDNGMGIAQKIQENVFEPFFTTKETAQGMGLGLAIVYGIIQDYSGEYHIESIPNEGTNFIIKFPRV